MQWSEIEVTVAKEHCETATAICHMVVPYGIYIEDYSDLLTQAPKIAHVDYYEQELLDKRKDIIKIHIYIDPKENPNEGISFIKERFDAEKIHYEVGMKNVKDEDWNTIWKKYYKPTKIGDRIVICPSWENYNATDKEVILKLDPGMAFGTGTHDTTRLCMELLEKYVTNDTKLLDIGCGSGILAIAGALLGAKEIAGCDIDKNAVKIAKENACVNNVQDKIDFYVGDLASNVKEKYSVISANIVADILIKLIPDVKNVLQEDGIFILSGIIETRKQDVELCLLNHGYEIIDTLENGGWISMSCKHM